MTEYPGAYPIDPTTTVGQVRLNVGDTTSVPLQTPIDGQQSYTNFSDAELQSYLTSASDSVPRATAFAFQALARAVAGAATKTDDLSSDPSKWAAVYMASATQWLAEADRQDALDSNSFFQIAPFVGLNTADTYCPPVAPIGPCFF